MYQNRLFKLQEDARSYGSIKKRYAVLHWSSSCSYNIITMCFLIKIVSNFNTKKLAYFIPGNTFLLYL